MVATEPVQYLQEPPSVVIDRVSMQFRVPTSEATEGPGGLRGLLRRRANMVTVNALNPMSLVAERGDSIGIVGRNGSGKSTLMKLICGQISPTGGAVYASSTPVMLGVNAALVPELPGDHNVVLGCLAMGLSREEINERYESIVELSGLEKAIHLPMRSYSSGMASRLRFAIAASIDPEILLIDEALNTGDAQFADRSKKRMAELRENAGCVFLVSHSLGTVKDMCTRAVWIDKGDLLMDGHPKDVVKTYQDFTRHLTKGNNISAAKIRDEAAAALTATQVLERTTGRRRAR
ncbi:Teichoic acids export ATP-binding protein TagH [Arthrobacter saudimassiliensis]|uniref:Teichoic acids export ATP-binding protein TagH n=1 Tax=Arthrobacter saudimassiliensis TaxID=1461584 RepID=A0A078MMD9_9MICC|nr:Teichoic acids export ATP-binding protein TagH [Arthrobacter saudimassiliensis]